MQCDKQDIGSSLSQETTGTQYFLEGPVYSRTARTRREWLPTLATCCLLPQKVTLSACKSKFAVTAHAEPCRSAAAKQYVWKEETRDGEQFEFGTPSVERSSVCDWEGILTKAKSGDLEGIPADVVIRYYSSLARIGADFAAPTALERTCIVYYGPTGTGKSRKAWEEAGLDAFPKDPRSKFWFGYKGQKNVVLDEFRGGIDISHLLRWLDRYPCNVEL